MPTSWYRVDAGRIAYTDTGTGPPIAFLHGNPTSAYMYRHAIRELSSSHRCIAPDYLGFGRSDQPVDASYRPPHQADRIEALFRDLDLRNLTLVVHDWGGPIGLSYALRHPERIARIVVLNTWLWPHNADPWILTFSLLAGGPIGRMLIRRWNAFVHLALPLGTRRRLSRDTIARYAAPFNTPARRLPTWIFPRALRTETAWLRSLWQQRRTLRSMDATIIWGRHDPAFGAERYLTRWTDLLPEATVYRTEASHYVAEDLGPELATLIRRDAPNRPPSLHL